MRKRLIALFMALLALCAGMMGCSSDRDVHETEEEATAIRIYDVEPQDIEECKVDQHYLRVGVFKDISDHTNSGAPFVNQIEKIKEETGADIEYLVFDNWEELLAAEKEFEDVRVTEMIMFNNTYEGSIIKEASSGRYADMEAALEEYGFYEEEAYNQAVLSAGIMESQQILVPILYNVSGMIQADGQQYSYEEWKELAYEHAESGKVDFEGLIEMLTKAMVQADVEGIELPFMTPGFLEDRVDPFLMASGIRLDSYERQNDLFTILYNYMKTYQETQVDTKEAGVSNQMLYGKYLNERMEQTLYVDMESYELRTVSEQEMADLKLESITYDSGEEPLFLLASSMLDRTEYFVECSTAEEIAFHSVFGLLGYRDYLGQSYNNGKMGSEFAVTQVENMSYWPVGVCGLEGEYAAQPICYAAVVDGGSTRLAAKVLQSMMNQPVDAKYGISTCNASMEEQIAKWMQENDQMGHIRGYDESPSGKIVVILEKAYWGILMGSYQGMFFEDKEIYGAQVKDQIDHIVAAEIPDRELLSIWQDTLTEAVESGLSAEAGFELLCERMDAWYKD